MLRRLEEENKELKKILHSDSVSDEKKNSVYLAEGDKYLRPKQSSSRKHSDLIAALEEIENRGKIPLQLTLTTNSERHAAQFLKGIGLKWREDIALLISYGMSVETEDELEKLKQERR